MSARAAAEAARAALMLRPEALFDDTLALPCGAIFDAEDRASWVDEHLPGCGISQGNFGDPVEVPVTEMRALTVRNPWAWAIAEGLKSVENRTWTTAYRGPLAIHAGRTLDVHAIPRVEDLARRSVPRSELVGGLVVAVAELVDVHAPEDCWEPSAGGFCSPWAESGAFHWVLEDVRPLRRVGPTEAGFGMQGALGLRRLPADYVAEILRRLS